MKKLLKSIFRLTLITVPWVLILGFIVFAYYYHDLPSIQDLKSKNNSKVINILYSNNNIINSVGDNYSDQITYNQIPKNLINAVIATEDRKFFSHNGFDSLAIIRAFYINLKAKRAVQGGSTITQQLVKLIYFNSEKTLKRKIQELLLAIKIERIFSKEQILTLYLNKAYFGAGNYGVSSASKHYFDKNLSDIDLNQAAMLAGLLKAPSKLAPTRNKELAQNRANQVLANMVNAGYLIEDDFGVFGQEINYKTDNLQKLYFSDYISEDFHYFLPRKFQNRQFFSVQTTLDKGLQNIAEDIIDLYYKKYSKKLQNSQIALVAMSYDGAIKAMIGGRNYQKSQFNRAIYAKRQPGSIFKTFIYLQALREGFNIDDKMIDSPYKIGNWQPENYNNKYYGRVTLKEAFSKSLNSISVQLYEKINKKELTKVIRKMGIFSEVDEHDPTISLGTSQVSLMELVTTFNVIANNGKGIIPYKIIKITDSKNDILYKRESSGIGQIIDANYIHDLKEILREAVTSGTGRNANVSLDIYGKTGTSQNFQDAWFIGFNDSYIIGIWIGNDNNSPTNNISGGSMPAKIFADIIKNTY